ncbi:MAG: DNA-3-methyladenine glycosylase 2 family protein [Gammaproteobacteria bacterium]|jgi:DNA-3-methyladenine glycosylase II
MPSQQQITRYLLTRDKRLKPVIEACRFPRSRKNNDIYYGLLSSIVSQQLSVKAADTIFNRFLDIFSDRYPDPALLAKMDSRRLRKAGLSQQKTQYLKNVAGFALDNDGMNYQRLKKMTDDDLIAHLTEIKGVGRWTVEMLLMFSFDRKDVFSSDDLGIQQAMSKLYRLNHDKRELKDRMLVIAENWRPYRTIVCKYLWQWKAMT